MQQPSWQGTPQQQEQRRFDGTRPRQVSTRTTIDYYAALIKHMRVRHLMRDARDQPFVRPNLDGIRDLLPVPETASTAATGYSSRYAQKVRDKNMTVANTVAFNPQGRRLLTGYHSGQIAMWSATSFNFLVTTDCHDSAVRTMQWSHSGNWLVSGDNNGVVKYWEPSLNNVKTLTPHVSAVRDLSFSPSDLKYATASDDGTVSIIDFERCVVERTLQAHTHDVRSVSWHPSQGLLLSASKDHTVRLWDPRGPDCVATLSGHTSGISRVRWNDNGRWFATASRDGLSKVWDIRTLRPSTVCRGHGKEVTSLAWHPNVESLRSCGGAAGARPLRARQCRD
jgi:polyadenylation factor subunit 2